MNITSYTECRMIMEISSAHLKDIYFSDTRILRVNKVVYIYALFKRFSALSYSYAN